MLASFPSLQQFPPITPENSWYSYFFLKLLIDVESNIYILRWLGEKYDGVRYCWNPRNEILYLLLSLSLSLLKSDSSFTILKYNRVGLELNVPHVFIDQLVDYNIYMEGELW